MCKEQNRSADIENELAAKGRATTRFSLDVDEKTWTLLQYDFVDMNQSVQPELIAAIEKEGVILYEKV